MVVRRELAGHARLRPCRVDRRTRRGALPVPQGDPPHPHHSAGRSTRPRCPLPVLRGQRRRRGRPAFPGRLPSPPASGTRRPARRPQGGAGRQVGEAPAAVDHCHKAGLHQAAVDFGVRGRVAADRESDPGLWWHFTEGASTAMASVGRAEEAEEIHHEVRAASADPDQPRGTPLRPGNRTGRRRRPRPGPHPDRVPHHHRPEVRPEPAPDSTPIRLRVDRVPLDGSTTRPAATPPLTTSTPSAATTAPAPSPTSTRC